MRPLLPAPLFHVSVLYELAPVGAGDGGFACLPGSHLDGATVGPPGQEKPVVHEIMREGIVPQPKSWGDWTPAGAWPDDLPVRSVTGQPGQAVLFVERLVHATMPWKGRGERRSLFFKYVQRGMHCALGNMPFQPPFYFCSSTEHSLVVSGVG